MSTIYVDNLQPNLGSQVEIPQLKPLTGSVVQVVNAYANATTTTTATYAGVALSGMQLSITIEQGSSIYAVVRVGAYGNNSSAWASTGRVALDRDGTVYALSEHQGAISMSEQCYTHFASHYSGPLSAGTYTYTAKGSSTTGGSIQFNRDAGGMGQLTLMEIAG
jgi:hypothetical protein